MGVDNTNKRGGGYHWNICTITRCVPLPLPYWGLLEPDSCGNAWFPTPSGAGRQFGAHSLDHDSRLINIALASGTATQVRFATRSRCATTKMGARPSPELII